MPYLSFMISTVIFLALGSSPPFTDTLNLLRPSKIKFTTCIYKVFVFFTLTSVICLNQAIEWRIGLSVKWIRGMIARSVNSPIFCLWIAFGNVARGPRAESDRALIDLRHSIHDRHSIHRSSLLAFKLFFKLFHLQCFKCIWTFFPRKFGRFKIS